MIKNKFAALFLFVASNAIAGQQTPSGFVTRTYTSTAWTMIQISSQGSSSYGCAKANYYAINTSSENYSAMLASVLAAQMAQKNVNFWVSGCGGQAGEYPKIESVVVDN